MTRTDGEPVFVERLRDDRHAARILDVRTDDFGGPYDAVLADAVLLHLSRAELSVALQRARSTVPDSALLGCTLEGGDAHSWTQAKLGLPRHFPDS